MERGAAELECAGTMEFDTDSDAGTTDKSSGGTFNKCNVASIIFLKIGADTSLA